MAHRIITQAALTGARILGTAFREAYKQASASQKYAAAAARSGKHNPLTHNSSGLTLEEACKILNVPPPKGGAVDVEAVMARFKKMFDANEPKNGGGSFYLQSKILRARERIIGEVEQRGRVKEEQEMVKEGWQPKVYKDR
jgi:import inner membrane translocase subunit TIM16